MRGAWTGRKPATIWRRNPTRCACAIQKAGARAALSQFVDEKLYRPGLGNYIRDKDEAAAKAAKAKS